MSEWSENLELGSTDGESSTKAMARIEKQIEFLKTEVKHLKFRIGVMPCWYNNEVE